MRNYRLVLILKRNLDKKEVEKLLSDVKKWAGDVKKDALKEVGEKKFAYKIGSEQSGNYIIWDFEAERVDSGFENKIKIQDNILRHLLVRVD